MAAPHAPRKKSPTTYWDYIRVEELLSLQGGLARDESALGNDEVLFIVVHQIDELWFKLALRELVAARDLMHRNPVPETALAGAVRSLRRLTAIMGHAADHFRLMETMTTRDYLGFRDKLMPASGFQSAQLREMEILLGLHDDDRIPFGHESSYRAALRAPGGRHPRRPAGWIGASRTSAPPCSAPSGRGSTGRPSKARCPGTRATRTSCTVSWRAIWRPGTGKPTTRSPSPGRMP